MARTITRLGIVLGLGTLLLGSACKPHYDGVQIRFLFGDGQHAHDRLEVVEGQATIIEVRPISDNPYEDYESFDLVDLESYNERIMFVAPAPELDQFVLAGAGLGQTVIRVLVNGREEDTLDATVVEQVTP
ncbi:hypothetical protein [Paraliomyxa miuraensis]|uniref:hypothetical protein n=1 Tax=Paraliomyxa miuraensis TaxID=376150 RepID=UPI00225296E9|nr:hypothetical protein [Paraliomyxa miuraensis]MCX4239686.1 hypothetical protein [Paraliomyxa miuraensis]